MTAWSTGCHAGDKLNITNRLIDINKKTDLQNIHFIQFQLLLLFMDANILKLDQQNLDELVI